MSQLILHNVERRIACLMNMPRDLDEAWPRPSTPVSISAASPAHRALFKEYEKELAEIAAAAVEWWKDRLTVKQRREKLDRIAALKAMYGETVAGPGGAPQVVWLVRK